MALRVMGVKELSPVARRIRLLHLAVVLVFVLHFQRRVCAADINATRIALKRQPIVAKEGPPHDALRVANTQTTWENRPADNITFIHREHHASRWHKNSGLLEEAPPNFKLMNLTSDQEQDSLYFLALDDHWSNITDGPYLSAKLRCSDAMLRFNLTATVEQKSRNLQITWGHGLLPSGALTFFNVTVKRISSDLVDTEREPSVMNFSLEIDNNQTEYSYMVESLLPSSLYDVAVRAVSEDEDEDEGEGTCEAKHTFVETAHAAPRFLPNAALRCTGKTRSSLTFELPAEKPRYLVRERSACFVMVVQRGGTPPPDVQMSNPNEITALLLRSASDHATYLPSATWIAASVECGDTETVTVGEVEEPEEPEGNSGPFRNILIINPPLQPSTRYAVTLVAVTLTDRNELLVGTSAALEVVTSGVNWNYGALSLLLLLLVPFVLFAIRRRTRTTEEPYMIPLENLGEKRRKKREPLRVEDEGVRVVDLPPAPPVPLAAAVDGSPSTRPASNGLSGAHSDDAPSHSRNLTYIDPDALSHSRNFTYIDPDALSHRVSVARFEKYARKAAASGELARQHALIPRVVHKPCLEDTLMRVEGSVRFRGLPKPCPPLATATVEEDALYQNLSPTDDDPQYANLPCSKEVPQYLHFCINTDELLYANTSFLGDDSENTVTTRCEPQYANTSAMKADLQLIKNCDQQNMIGDLQELKRPALAPEQPSLESIDACAVVGYGGRRYIATQGPSMGRVAHFWHHVWEEKVLTIVMLTGLVEKKKTKCGQYWPEPGKPLQVGHGLTARVVAPERVRAYHVERNIMLTLQFGNDGDALGEVEEREVLQLHCTSWPDDSIPLSITPVACFVRMVRERVRSKEPGRPGEMPPLLVHCSGGLGHIGTFILADSCADMAAAECAVDPLLLLGRLCKQSAKLVETMEQYILAHALLLELLLEERTAVAGAGELKEAGVAREAVRRMRNQGLLDRQFLCLARHPPLPLFPSVLQQIKAKRLRYDPHSDRSPGILPGIVGAVQLQPMGEGASDYVNAVWVDDVERSNAAIATQLPLPSMTSTLWRLAAQVRAPLLVALHRPSHDDPWTPSWYPEGVVGAEVALPGGVELKVLELDRLPHCTWLRVRASVPDSVEAVVEILQMECWALNSPLPPSPSALLALWREVERRRPAMQPFIVLCRDGALGCGLFLALDHTLQLLRLERSLDPAEVVRTLRPPRPAFVTLQVQFEFLFDAAVEYVEQFEEYIRII